MSESSDRLTCSLSVSVSLANHDLIKVNNVNVTELKNTCNDTIKHVCYLTLFIENFLI